MRERLRVVLAVGLYYSGLVGLARWWQRRSGRRLIILNYHRVEGDNLRCQLLYLRRHYRIMHLEAALEEFYSPAQRGKMTDRRLPLVLTFDDGYLDNYTRGLPLARELQIPITLFLIPEYIESGNYFWWLAGKFLAQHTRVDKVTIEEHTYQLAVSGERKELAKVIDTKLRYASSVVEREALLSALQRALEVTLPRRAPALTDDDALPLTWAEVLEMEQSGWVSFGAHTMHHQILAHLADPAEVQREVTQCRQVLEQHLGHPVRTFAYPVGKFKHFQAEGLQAVKAAGYEWALTTIEEMNTPQTDPHLLRRLPGTLEQHWLMMAAELVGLWGFWSRIRKKR